MPPSASAARLALPLVRPAGPVVAEDAELSGVGGAGDVIDAFSLLF
jgi:hypothetical protein